MNILKDFRATQVDKTQRMTRCAILCFAAMMLATNLVNAAPQGGEITAGSGDIQTPNSTTTVVTQESQTLSINWESLNLNSNELLKFNQPGRDSISLNHILDQNPSQIHGRIDANGQVFLMNPNGMIFGESARINTSGLFAGAFQMDSEFLNSQLRSGEYTLNIGDGSVENYGSITTLDGGQAVLLGNSVLNAGSIDAKLGKIHLLSADEAVMSFDQDGMIQFAISKESLTNAANKDNAIENSGILQADGGYVVLDAQATNDVFVNVVNNSGVIRATKISNEGGVIRLEGIGANVITSGTLDVSGDVGSSGGTIHVLGDRVGVLGEASIDASGDTGGGNVYIGGERRGEGEHNADFTLLSAGAEIHADALLNGDGGEVIVWADDTSWAFGDISARGGELSGDGGFVEISGKQGLVLDANVDLLAPQGKTGTLLLDPADIVIHDQADGVQANDGEVTDFQILSGDGVGTFDIGELKLEGLLAGTNVILEATNSITINDLADNDLGLKAGSGDSITITAGGNFSMNTGDTISTLGGDIGITGASITLGTLDTGAGSGDITVASTASMSIDTATAGTGAVSLTVDSDSATVNGTETLTITASTNNSLSGSSVTLLGGDTGPNDTLVAPNAVNTWTIAGGQNQGTLNTDYDYNYFPFLQGGTNDDSFAFIGNANLSGDINGGGESAGDSADYSAATGTISVTLNSDVFDIESLIGNGAAYTLQGRNVANTWTITTENDGTVDGVSFTDFGNLTGGIGNDDFVLSGGSVTGVVAGGGGAGTDSITANDTTNIWTINSANGGTIDNSNISSFSGIANLTGGTGIDTFILSTGTGSISGVIDGGTGNDRLGAQNIANTWTITGPNAGNINGTETFTSIETLIGGTDTDDFNFDDLAVIGVEVDGGTGTDTVDQSLQTGAVTINLGNGTYSNIEEYTGNNNSTLNAGNAIANTWLINAAVGDGSNDGSVNDGSGAITFENFNNLTGGTDDDSFTLSGGILTGVIDGGANTAGGDTLTADNAVNTFDILTADAGDVTGIGTFTDIENLVGNALKDSFVFDDAGSLSGTIDGAGGATDEVDFLAETGAVTVTIGAAGFTNIESYIGNAHVNTLIIGGNVANDWDLTGANSGTINVTTSFSNFNNITGGTDVDNVTVNGGTLAGTLDGGDGSDTIFGDNQVNTWNITGGDSGNLNTTDIAFFTNIENLTGNALADSFDFTANPGSISGVINGAAGTNDVNYSAKTIAVSVDLSSAAFLNINTFTGTTSAASTITGPNSVNTWDITGTDDGTINTLNFVNFDNLIGHDGVDTFTLSGGSITDSITGGNGNDILNGVAGGATWNITGANIGNTTGVAAFNTIETLQGGAGIDAYVFADGSSFATVINGGAGASTDVVNFSAEMGAISVDLDNSNYVDIESFVGNNPDGTGSDYSSTLLGSDNNNVWTIDGTNSGDVDGILFSGFNHLLGDSFTDQFILNGGDITGSVVGAGGSDEIVSDDTIPTTWTIPDSGTNTGDLTNIALFDGIENLTGGTNTDYFDFGDGSSITGNVNGGGGGGANTVDFASETGAVSIPLTGTKYTNIDTFIGNNTSSTLTGDSGDNTWTITGVNDGNVVNTGVTTNFTDFNNIVGNTGNDDFDFTTGSIANIIDGGGGANDSVDLSLATVTVNVVLDGNSFQNIENYTGKGASSTITGANNANIWDITGANSGTIDSTITFTNFHNLTGGNAADTFSLNTGTISGNVDGAAGTDTLAADNTTNTWSITATGTGTVTGITGTFSNIENITGNDGADTFTFADGVGVAGVVDGSNGSDSVNRSLDSGVSTVTMGNGVGEYNNIEDFVGNGANNTMTLVADDAINSWIIDDANSGTVGTTTFSGFTNLRGGSDVDTFSLTNDGVDYGYISGSIDGAGGNDTLIADDLVNTWNITVADEGNVRETGDVVEITPFVNIETLQGNDNTDTFIFANGSSFGGLIDGGANTDVVDQSSQATAVIDLASGQYQNIESYIGNNTDTTLIGQNVSNIWTIDGVNDGNVNGLLFTDVNKLQGNSSDDTFILAGGSISVGGSVDGVSGNDTIQADNINNNWNITSADAGNVNGIPDFQNIDNLVGNNSIDTFNLGFDISGNADGGAGDDIFNVTAAISVGGSLIGGTGTDRLNGPNLVNTWTITALNTGVMNGINFSQVENLYGGTAVDAFTVTNAAGATIGNIDAGAGDDTFSIDYTAASTRSINYTGGPGTDSMSLTGSGAGMVNSYAFGPGADDVAVTSTSGASSQTLTALEVESLADSMTATTVSLTATSGDDAITLSPGSIGGIQPISLVAATMLPVEFSNKTNLSLDTGLGNDSITINGAIALPGDITFTTESLIDGAAASLAANNLILNNVGTAGASGNRLQTTINNLQVTGTTTDVYINEQDGLSVSAANVSGAFDISTLAGNITSSGNVVVTGSSAFNVGDGGSIILDGAGNQFAGTPVLTSAGTINDLTLVDNSAVNLPAIVTSGDLAITASGITQSGAFTVVGDSVFTSTSDNILLDNPANDFTGTVVLQNSGNNTITLRDQNALTFGSTSIGNGTLTVQAGSIAQTGPITQLGGAGATTFTANTGSLILDNASNNFTGVVSLINNSSNSTQITESNQLNLGSSTLSGGDLTVTVDNGINLSGTTVSNNGDITVTANTGNIQLGRLNSGTGRLTVNAVTGDVLGNNSPISDPNLSATTLEIIAGQVIGDFNNPISVSVPSNGTSFFQPGIGSANIIGLTGTILGGLVNNVAFTGLAIAKGQSVSFVANEGFSGEDYYLLPLYTLVDGAVQWPDYTRGEEGEDDQ